MSDETVLPVNSSALERGIERAFTDLLYGMENPYPSLLNPATSKKRMLPYIAQDRGVSEWDSAAPESEQRLTAGNAWAIRRLAGTKKGLMLAMDSLEHDSEVIPWYQMAPKGNPHHFELIAWKRRNAPINQEVVQRMIDHIEDAKSERDTYELILALGAEAGFVFSGAVDRGITIFDESYEGAISGSPEASGAVGVSGASYQVLSTDDVAASVLPDRSFSAGEVAVGGAFRMYLLTEFSPGANL